MKTQKTVSAVSVMKKIQKMTIYRRHTCMSSRDKTNFVTLTTGLSLTYFLSSNDFALFSDSWLNHEK